MAPKKSKHTSNNKLVRLTDIDSDTVPKASTETAWGLLRARLGLAESLPVEGVVILGVFVHSSHLRYFFEVTPFIFTQKLGCEISLDTAGVKKETVRQPITASATPKQKHSAELRLLITTLTDSKESPDVWVSCAVREPTQLVRPAGPDHEKKLADVWTLMRYKLKVAAYEEDLNSNSSEGAALTESKKLHFCGIKVGGKGDTVQAEYVFQIGEALFNEVLNSDGESQVKKELFLLPPAPDATDVDAVTLLTRRYKVGNKDISKSKFMVIFGYNPDATRRAQVARLPLVDPESKFGGHSKAQRETAPRRSEKESFEEETSASDAEEGSAKSSGGSEAQQKQGVARRPALFLRSRTNSQKSDEAPKKAVTWPTEGLTEYYHVPSKTWSRGAERVFVLRKLQSAGSGIGFDRE